MAKHSIDYLFIWIFSDFSFNRRFITLYTLHIYIYKVTAYIHYINTYLHPIHKRTLTHRIFLPYSSSSGYYSSQSLSINNEKMNKKKLYMWRTAHRKSPLRARHRATLHNTQLGCASIFFGALNYTHTDYAKVRLLSFFCDVVIFFFFFLSFAAALVGVIDVHYSIGSIYIYTHIGYIYRAML